MHQVFFELECKNTLCTHTHMYTNLYDVPKDKKLIQQMNFKKRLTKIELSAGRLRTARPEAVTGAHGNASKDDT